MCFVFVIEKVQKLLTHTHKHISCTVCALKSAIKRLVFKLIRMTYQKEEKKKKRRINSIQYE